MRLRFATYNVHGFVGMDRRRDVDRVQHVIDELDADVVALQEVEMDSTQAELDWLRRLAADTDYHVIAGPTMRRGYEDYGNALLVRHQPLEVHLHDLSERSREPRGAIETRIATPAGTVQIIATHLGLRRSERRAQIERLLTIFASGPSDGADVLLGDFNIWWPRARNVRRFRRVFSQSVAPRSFPATLPVLRLDRIWVDSGWSVADSGTHRSRLARIASDHAPIWCELQLPG